jgi:hypothetical protein
VSVGAPQAAKAPVSVPDIERHQPYHCGTGTAGARANPARMAN